LTPATVRLSTTAVTLKTHVVRRGDYLPRIAHQLGVDPDDIWNHPKNKPLRDLRGDWHILAEGDVLTIPEAEQAALPIAAGQVNC
jgi:nucleoid-associated protein YgaU